mmetsp:Transcript_15502/g.33933  ORF Transcript_15502/g.33933 Transcript_15502/m.33933 type:complete len:81 (-) Transcript_15502:19-261(-)
MINETGRQHNEASTTDEIQKEGKGKQEGSQGVSVCIMATVSRLTSSLKSYLGERRHKKPQAGKRTSDVEQCQGRQKEHWK